MWLEHLFNALHNLHIFTLFSICLFHRVKDEREREKIFCLSAGDQAFDGGQGVVETTSNKQEDEATKLNFPAVG